MSRQIGEEPPALAGSIEFLVDEEQLIKPIDECWNADAHMFIAELIFNREAIEKLARRRISVREVGQLPANGPLVTRNPVPRVPGSRLMIGLTDGGRTLTIVIQPDVADAGAWHVMTGWDSTPREAAAFRRRS